VSDIPFQVVFPIVFVTIVYWMMDLREDAARFFAILGFIILCANCAISMGFFVAAISPNLNVSSALGPMLIFPQVMFCGFLLNTASIPIVSRVCKP
jgi:ABC-type multidrug transport system permease subunit